MELLDTPNVIRSIQPNQKRAQWAIILIVCVVIFKTFSAIMGLMAVQAYHYSQIGITSAESDYRLWVIIAAVLSLLLILSRIISIVTFILWFHRAYSNITMKSDGLNDTPGATAYSWFIPWLNWVRPFAIMKEMHSETRDVLERYEIKAPFKLSILRVNWWWTLWIVCSIIGVIETIAKSGSDVMQTYEIEVKWEAFSLIFFIPLSILTMKMIRDYSKIEPLLQDAPDVVQIEAPTHAEL